MHGTHTHAHSKTAADTQADMQAECNESVREHEPRFAFSHSLPLLPLTALASRLTLTHVQGKREGEGLRQVYDSFQPLVSHALMMQRILVKERREKRILPLLSLLLSSDDQLASGSIFPLLFKRDYECRRSSKKGSGREQRERRKEKERNREACACAAVDRRADRVSERSRCDRWSSCKRQASCHKHKATKGEA